MCRSRRCSLSLPLALLAVTVTQSSAHTLSQAGSVRIPLVAHRPARKIHPPTTPSNRFHGCNTSSSLTGSKSSGSGSPLCSQNLDGSHFRGLTDRGDRATSVEETHCRFDGLNAVLELSMLVYSSFACSPSKGNTAACGSGNLIGRQVRLCDCRSQPWSAG